MPALLRATGLLGVVLLGLVFVLPVRVYDHPRFSSSTITLAGSPDSALPWVYLALVVATAALVVLGLRRGPGVARAVLLAALGALAAYLVTRLGADFVVTWSEDDALGRPAGGLARTELAAGAWSGIAGGVLLVVSAIGSPLVRTNRRSTLGD